MKSPSFPLWEEDETQSATVSVPSPDTLVPEGDTSPFFLPWEEIGGGNFV